MLFSVNMYFWRWGFLGSMAAEIFQRYSSGTLQRLIGYSKEKLFSYVIVRAAGSALAGFIAVAYAPSHPLIAIAVGASAHLLILRMSNHEIDNLINIPATSGNIL